MPGDLWGHMYVPWLPNPWSGLGIRAGIPSDCLLLCQCWKSSESFSELKRKVSISWVKTVYAHREEDYCCSCLLRQILGWKRGQDLFPSLMQAWHTRVPSWSWWWWSRSIVICFQSFVCRWIIESESKSISNDMLDQRWSNRAILRRKNEEKNWRLALFIRCIWRCVRASFWGRRENSPWKLIKRRRQVRMSQTNSLRSLFMTCRFSTSRMASFFFSVEEEKVTQKLLRTEKQGSPEEAYRVSQTHSWSRSQSLMKCVVWWV